MKNTTKRILALCLTVLIFAALSIPAAADAVFSPMDYVRYTPLGAILAGVLVIVAVLITILLIRFFFGNKKNKK